jgi:hypothetical protein
VVEFPNPQEMRKRETERAFSKIKSKDKACINCLHAEPFPYPMCQLVITCMRKPPKKTKDWRKLRFYSAMVRFQDASADACGKFKLREKPECFLRKLVWIKRFVWFLHVKTENKWTTYPEYDRVVNEVFHQKSLS